MNRVPLSDEETKVIFSTAARDALGDVDGNKQQAILNRLVNVVSSSSLPSAFVYERIANLDIIAVGDQCRLYTKIVEEIPEGDVEYHVIFLFYIDDTHDYEQGQLAEFNQSAEQYVDKITSFDDVDDVEGYLESRDALGEDDLRELAPD